jgi:thymidylate synthase
MLKIRNGCLDWTQIIRSNDVWRGLPHNLVQFTSLQEIMAGWLGCKLGTYCQMSDSLHVYMDDEDANNLRSSTPIEVVPNPDSLALPKSESEEFFRELAARVDRMVGNELGEKDIVRLAQFRDAPASIQNT